VLTGEVDPGEKLYSPNVDEIGRSKNGSRAKNRRSLDAMIQTDCYNDYPQEFLKAIDALFDTDAIEIDVQDELISNYSETSRKENKNG